jgi:FkbM family methyltransferase
LKPAYLAGFLIADLQTRLLASRHFPLFHRFLSQRSWPYDVCRFANTRDFGTIFDVGANVGQTTLLLKRYFPRSTIHSFEPVSSTFKDLKSRCGRLRGVHLHQLALANESGQMTIHLQSDSELNSLRFLASGPADSGAEVVSVTTVAAFCEHEGIDRIDALKIDAQGADLDVLRGAKPLLTSARVPFVLTEVAFPRDDIANQQFEPVHHFLCDHGFRLSGFYEVFNYGPRLSLLGFCNALYVHPEALEQRFPDRPATG